MYIESAGYIFLDLKVESIIVSVIFYTLLKLEFWRHNIIQQKINIT